MWSRLEGGYFGPVKTLISPSRIGSHLEEGYFVRTVQNCNIFSLLMNFLLACFHSIIRRSAAI